MTNYLHMRANVLYDYEINQKDFVGVYALWAAGRCPCCGSEIGSWPAPDGTYVEPEAVAEGVKLCGLCIGNNHHTDSPKVLEGILMGIVKRW